MRRGGVPARGGGSGWVDDSRRASHDARARPHQLLPRRHRRDAGQARWRLRRALRYSGAFVRERALVRVDVAAVERREGIEGVGVESPRR